MTSHRALIQTLHGIVKKAERHPVSIKEGLLDLNHFGFSFISFLLVLPFMQPFKIGCAQCLSLIPGVSRAAATIMGGMLTGLNRQTATEFSFYLAIPIITAASLFDLLKNFQDLTLQDLPIFAIGFVTAFLSAYAVIKLFIRFVATHTFISFAWYRIILGILVFIYFSG